MLVGRLLLLLASSVGLAGAKRGVWEDEQKMFLHGEVDQPTYWADTTWKLERNPTVQDAIDLARSHLQWVLSTNPQYGWSATTDAALVRFM